MTIDQLIEELEEQREEFGGDTEVRLMTQQNYPFEQRIDGVTTLAAIHDYQGEEKGFKPAASRGWETRDTDRPTAVIYLLEGDQLGYGTKDAWETA